MIEVAKNARFGSFCAKLDLAKFRPRLGWRTRIARSVLDVSRRGGYRSNQRFMGFTMVLVARRKKERAKKKPAETGN